MAGLGLVAKATLGGAVAVAGVASAGAAGLLPAAVVDRVRPVVEAVTPFHLDSGTVHDERDRGGDGRPAEPGSGPPPAAVGGGTTAGGPVTTGPPDLRSDDLRSGDLRPAALRRRA